MIDNQTKSYRLVLNNIECTFIPMELFLNNEIMPIRKQVHKTKGYLFWNVSGKQISYNKIKSEIKKQQQ